MITISSAEAALKTVYLDVLSQQLNTNVNPVYSKIKQSGENIYGKDIRVAAPFGINSSFKAGTEDGDLPDARNTEFVQFVSTLKNLYGHLEISDKAMRASMSNTGAFVNLLNMEMDSLIRSCNFNLNRMFFGDSHGVLGRTVYSAPSSKTIPMSTAYSFLENMVVDYYQGNTLRTAGLKVVQVIYSDLPTVVFDREFQVYDGGEFCLPGCRHLEMHGLESLYGNHIYGLSASDYPWLNPGEINAGGWLREAELTKAIDTIEIKSGTAPTHIITSQAARKTYADALKKLRQNIDVMTLEGGYTALSFNGIPVIADRFCPLDTAYIININDFKFYQLCDWTWIEGDSGKVLHQNPGKATYSATLVKYADMLCLRPGSQYRLTGIYNFDQDA